MNIKILSTLAKKHPALARALEIGLYSLILYALGALLDGNAISYHAGLVALLTPVYAYLGKRRRDLEK